MLQIGGKEQLITVEKYLLLCTRKINKSNLSMENTSQLDVKLEPNLDNRILNLTHYILTVVYISYISNQRVVKFYLFWFYFVSFL